MLGLLDSLYFFLFLAPEDDAEVRRKAAGEAIDGGWLSVLLAASSDLFCCLFLCSVAKKQSVFLSGAAGAKAFCGWIWKKD